MLTLYGDGRLPWTSAATPPRPTSSFTTCPLRAYDRPRASRAGPTSRSSAAIQRPAHQLLPNRPRCVWALMPFGDRGAAVQEQHLTPECRLEVLLQHAAHLGVLREHQRAVADRRHLFEHL